VARFRYKEGFLYCRKCLTHWREEQCPMYESPGRSKIKYRVCPNKECPRLKLRSRSHNKKWKEYYARAIRPEMDKIQEQWLIIKQQDKMLKKNNKK
jgi:hypothetical protein